MAAIGSTRTPERLIPKLVHSSVAPVRVEDVSFWEYMTLDELAEVRPPRWNSGVREKTAENYDRNLFQIYREMGLQLLDRATVHRLRVAQAYGEHVPLPVLPWENRAPDWAAILAWRDAKVKATLETHQKALVGLAFYWGQSGLGMPHFLRTVWASETAKNNARQAGEMEEYDLHLDDLPNDIAKLLGARPFETKHRVGKMARNRRLLQIARYKDKLGRSIVFQWFYTGPRVSEGCTLRLGMFQPQRGGIIGWPQPKKGMAPRDVVYQERMDFVWTSKVDPSFRWYIENVRPLVYRPERPTDIVYLNSDGEPWTEDGLRAFIREYIALALDGDGRGPHSLRRACATWLYHHGWEVEEIALLLDDTPAVVRRSYLNWTWIKRVGRKNERSKTTRPPVPLLRSSGTTNARSERKTSDPQAAPRVWEGAPRFSEGRNSAPAGI